MAAADEAQAAAYRLRWRARQAATYARAARLRGNPAARAALTQTWLPLLIPVRAIPIGDDPDAESERAAQDRAN